MLKIMLLLSVLFVGCTENMKVKNFGGKQTIVLPHGSKVINVTWKLDDLWILTTKRALTDTAKEYRFIEKSSFGIWNGEIILIER